MEKVIHKLINEFTEGVDTYTYNGSTWLIFTESKQWVIELTDSKTLWYNYNFFKSVFLIKKDPDPQRCHTCIGTVPILR